MKNNGFSLIEASIALIIIGLLMTPIMAEYNRETKQQKIDISQANNQAVKFAVEQFFRDKGRYPCPADPTKKVGDPDFGKEICPPVSATPGKCTTGVCVANAVVGGSGRVLYGAVPFTDLKIDFTKAMDGWSHKISFAVAEPLTTNPAGATAGNIVIETIDTDTDNIIPLTGVGHFLVISSGENGKGSFNADGNMVTSDAKFDIGTG
jgi:prepilin-type N-terminal cleavage/methylation domain-containing protein